MNTPWLRMQGNNHARSRNRAQRRAALAEGRRQRRSLGTTRPRRRRRTRNVSSRENSCLCGNLAWFQRCFEKLDETIVIVWKAKPGRRSIKPGQLCDSKARALLLTGERTALSFLQLSGVSHRALGNTPTRRRYQARRSSTRKTLPGLRLAQKFRGQMRRRRQSPPGLYDAILIRKTTSTPPAIPPADGSQQVADATEGPLQVHQVEVETLDELQQALAAGQRMVLLDNMSLAQMH